MLTISPEAVTFIRGRGSAIYLDLPKMITNCCFDFQECPSVRRGEPRDLREFEVRIIEGVTVFVPRRLPEMPLTIEVSSFLGIKRLVVEGWSFF